MMMMMMLTITTMMMMMLTMMMMMMMMMMILKAIVSITPACWSIYFRYHTEGNSINYTCLLEYLLPLSY